MAQHSLKPNLLFGMDVEVEVNLFPFARGKLLADTPQNLLLPGEQVPHSFESEGSWP